MKNRKGFTLIEILAVIVILGVIIGIAVPSVSGVIRQSKNKTYLEAAQKYVDAVRKKVVSKEYIFNSRSITYYVAIENIEVDRKGGSPFADWQEAYVVITYDGTNYDYYWTSVDMAGYKVNLKKIDDIVTNNIIANSSLIINTGIGIGGRTKIRLIDKSGNEVNKVATSQL